MHTEITTNIPPEIPERYPDGLTPVFLAYGCVLLEGYTGMAYVYKAVNLETGDRTHLCQLRARLTPSCYEQMAARIRDCEVTDTGRMEIDAHLGKRIGRDNLSAILEAVFRELLPDQGYRVREQQVELASHILDCFCRRNISLAEAEVGTGKTLAYLVAAALVKRSRFNDLWIKGDYPDLAYITSMPVVVSTSSIALQNAIVWDYIPELSRILLQYGVINTPLTCVLRKGREHYLCEKRLRNFLQFERDPATIQALKSLRDKRSGIDLGAVDSLTPYIKSKIGVTGRCDRNCPHYKRCRYLAFLKDAQSDRNDFQVCNHNYFLADILRRRDGQQPLIPHYQAVVIDEGHKLLQAARQMYGVELSSAAIPRIADDIRGFTFRKGESGSKVWRLAKKLAGHSERLFRHLGKNITKAVSEEEVERFPAAMDVETTRHLLGIVGTIDRLTAEFAEHDVLIRYKGRYEQILWELASIRNQAVTLENHGELVCWMESPARNTTSLHAIPKNLDERLYRDFWRKGIPVVLTSGTLSAAGDFSRIKRTLGLHHLPPTRLMQTSKTSPFDHRNNTLLYISEKVPFPDSSDRAYLTAVADEIERLVRVSHGHAAVLFTSYKAMDMVRELLEDRHLPFPLFQLSRGRTDAIDHFKQSGNGILLASGALWEGIDIPGDTLSMLIIVKLPFPVPDPIGEYEQSLYPNMGEYKNQVIVPDTQIRLCQGSGRLVRIETDTGVIALLDSRMWIGATYRKRMLHALPNCRITSEVADVTAFMHEKKSEEYFQIQMEGQVYATYN